MGKTVYDQRCRSKDYWEMLAKISKNPARCNSCDLDLLKVWQTTRCLVDILKIMLRACACSDSAVEESTDVCLEIIDRVTAVNEVDERFQLLANELVDSYTFAIERRGPEAF